jgi:hypothetical protein
LESSNTLLCQMQGPFLWWNRLWNQTWVRCVHGSVLWTLWICD